MMKLQSQISRKYGDTEYKKFWIILPYKILEKLGWETGQDLKAGIEKNKLIIKKQ